MIKTENEVRAASAQAGWFFHLPMEKTFIWGAIIPLGLCFWLSSLTWAGHALGAEFTVAAQMVTDKKVIYGTVQAAVEVPARARISGTLTSLSVEEGAAVNKDAVIATISDEKLILRGRALDASIASAQSSLDNSQTEYERAQKLFERGTISKSRIDLLETALTVTRSNLKAAEAEKAVLVQQMDEGRVLAPAAGRVLEVPVTAGSVVMGGEVIATIAQQGFLLRIEVPERHARFMKVGDSVETAAESGGKTGKIVKIYPKISQGRVVADAQLAGLGDYFIGERVAVRIAVGERSAIVIPPDFVSTRHGLDFVSVKGAAAGLLDVVVELGHPQVLEDGTPGVEILSGLRDGDVVVKP